MLRSDQVMYLCAAALDRQFNSHIDVCYLPYSSKEAFSCRRCPVLISFGRHRVTPEATAGDALIRLPLGAGLPPGCRHYSVMMPAEHDMLA